MVGEVSTVVHRWKLWVHARPSSESGDGEATVAPAGMHTKGAMAAQAGERQLCWCGTLTLGVCGHDYRVVLFSLSFFPLIFFISAGWLPGGS